MLSILTVIFCLFALIVVVSQLSLPVMMLMEMVKGLFSKRTGRS